MGGGRVLAGRELSGVLVMFSTLSGSHSCIKINWTLRFVQYNECSNLQKEKSNRGIVEVSGGLPFWGSREKIRKGGRKRTF